MTDIVHYHFFPEETLNPINISGSYDNLLYFYDKDHELNLDFTHTDHSWQFETWNFLLGLLYLKMTNRNLEKIKV